MKRFAIFTIGLLMIMIHTMTVDASGIGDAESTHPRVIIDKSRISDIVSNCNGALNTVYRDFLSECEEIIAQGPTEYYEAEDIQELWMRDVGNNIMKLSFAYLMTHDEKYSSAAAEIVAAAEQYPSWGRTSVYCNKDLACAHMLFGVSAYYDWCHNTLSESEKEHALNLLIEKGNGMYNNGAGGWWRKSFLQNHLWINAASLMVAGAAIYDDAPQISEKWMTQAEVYYKEAFSALPKDGSTTEGFLYWQYGISHMIYYLNTAQNCGRENYTASEFVKQTGNFANYLVVGEGYKITDTSVFDFSDSDEDCGGAYIAELSYLAALNRSEQTQWFVHQGLDSRADKKSYWKVLMYYDSTLAQEQPNDEEYPCDKLFLKTGYGFMRTGWGKNQTALAFHCGRAVGLDAPYRFKTWSKGSDLGTGHLHPDMNHISLYYNGYKLLSDDGYTASRTSDHNTLIVNGAGQYGEGKNWTNFDVNPDEGPDAVSEVKRFIGTKTYAYAMCDATAAYGKSGMVDKFNRHILFIKKGVVIVIDDIALSDASADAYVQYFSDLPFQEEKDGTFQYDNTAVAMAVKTFGYGDAQICDGKRMINSAGLQENAQILKIRNRANSTNWVQPVSFSYAEGDLDFYEVSLESAENGKFLFMIQSKNDAYDREYYEIDINEAEVKEVEHQLFHISVDAVNKAVTITGDLYYGKNALLDIMVTDEKKNIRYMDRQSVEGNRFETSFVLDGSPSGIYEADIYSSEYRQHAVLSFYLPEMEEQISLLDYAIDADEEVKGDFHIKNSADTSKTVMVIIAKYDHREVLVDSKFESIVLKANADTIYHINCGFKKNKDESVRIYLWDHKMCPRIGRI